MASTARQKLIIKQAARRHHTSPRLLWGIYGAESSFGKAKSSFGLTGDYPGVGTSGNFRKDANRSAEILHRLKRETGSYEGALRKYSGGSYGLQHVHQLDSQNPPGFQHVLDAEAAGNPTTVTFRDTKVARTPGTDRSDERRKAILSYMLAQTHQSAGALTFAGVDPKPYYGQQGLLTLGRTLNELSDTPSTLKVTSKDRKVTVGGGGGGSVQFAPGADRPGVHTVSAVKKFVRKISGLDGHPLTVGTGTQHSHMTTNGTVSDHWSGHAADIPATGKRLIHLGQLALIAAGMPRKQALKQKGGLFNVGGHQIIYGINDPARGGNHLNHLHVSAY